MWGSRKIKRQIKIGIMGFLTFTYLISGIATTEYAFGSDVWPQKSTAPFYCLDGGKSWRASDQYKSYEYDTMPSALTEIQAKRLFWAYPTNWNALKEATKIYDPELYKTIAETSSGPNVVKHVKDDGTSMFAWVADNPEIEQRAIQALEQHAKEDTFEMKEAPSEIRDAVSADTAMFVTIPAFGPGSLDTEIRLGEEFVKDIANIEMQSVWDNGSDGGDAGWRDVSLEKNKPSGIMGNQLYEVTWLDGVIRIHNNGIASVHENSAGSAESEHESNNKSMVLYKVTMRKNSGWNAVGGWNSNYLHEWMEFKSCENAPGHQRLYKADIKISPSDVNFYVILSQNPSEDEDLYPEFGSSDADLSFQIYRHKELFEANYHVKLKKIDDETEKPLKGSQFYLYERLEDLDQFGSNEKNGQLVEKHLNFRLWEGYQIFDEGTTDENGEIVHTDVRTYQYEKTYCDGHGLPDWANAEVMEGIEESVLESNAGSDLEKVAAENEARDKNIAVAEQWMQLYHACEEMVERSNGTHFHWLVDDEIYLEIEQVMDSGEPEWEDGPGPQSAKESFEASGCKADCEKTYNTFIHLRFAYTWREVKARDGYILHGIHEDDLPIEVIATNASEAGAESVKLDENSNEIKDHTWYGGQSKSEESYLSNDEWEEDLMEASFETYYESVEADGIKHINVEEDNLFSYPDSSESGKDYWQIRDHRSEGEIYFNKRDMDLWKEESETYSAYGDTEGDGKLAGAVYGLFAADDIVHPDSDFLADGTLSNTGIVYRKHDLAAIAETDAFGNGVFSYYTEKPGMYYDYEEKRVRSRTDFDWDGPGNRYDKNGETYGSCWVGRPLILGNYYIKELSRSEGYELSINGKSDEWTNYGREFETPDTIAGTSGCVKVSLMDMMGSMEGEDLTGNGYDQILFCVASSDTSGYEIKVEGLPEGTEFYRIDFGETEVMGPRVVGTETVIVRDENGEALWKIAEKDGQYLKYMPEYGEDGAVIGQSPIYRSEWQILKDEQIPEMALMEITDIDLDMTDSRWSQKLNELFAEEDEEYYLFFKAEFERFLRKNNYRTPETFDGKHSQSDKPVYSMGVKKGQTDLYEMTTYSGEPAQKTVYGAAVSDFLIQDLDEEATLYDLFIRLVEWYMEHPQWSFGGIHSLEESDDGYEVVVYSGISTNRNRRFFTIDSDCDPWAVDKVYTVVENPVTLRWEYQEYEENGDYSFEVERQYCYGNGNNKRYYIDVILSPAVMADSNGEIVRLEHTVMEYHKQGEEVIDYLLGDPEHGYRVYQTREIDKIEISSELEYTEADVPMETVIYDQESKQYLIPVEMEKENSFGEWMSDTGKTLELTFMAKLPESTVMLSEREAEQLNGDGISNYQSGDVLGYGEYLIKMGDVAVGISKESQIGIEDTYIVGKDLIYRSQYKVQEDGGTEMAPIQVLERPIKQKVKIVKQTEQGEAVGNFQFKIYLKSNLENLYCDENGEIVWLDLFGGDVDISEYKSVYPELVQKIKTKKTSRRLLEVQKNGEQNNYKKFFDAIYTANLDKWENVEGCIKNTSSKPVAKAIASGIRNEINISDAAVENAKRSDAIRQFAVTWYLKDHVQELTEKAEESDGLQIKQGSVVYSDELYDAALYEAIQDAEEYLQPFFRYDLDSVYEINWDSALAGDRDHDLSTLAAGQFLMTGHNLGSAYGISEYLPYGEYVIVEQQPLKKEEDCLPNRHYQVDEPRELALPQYDLGDGTYQVFSEVLWTVTEPGRKKEMSGYAEKEFFNKKYKVIVRIEKNDFETGEPILHDDAVFAFYKAETVKEKTGEVKRYAQETLITGSRLFLEAMGARQITETKREAGRKYWGFVPAGTPVCREEDVVIFTDMDGKQQGEFPHVSTMLDHDGQGILQNVGYVEIPGALEAGTYVLAELKAPEGYIRSKPVAVEVYSDEIRYSYDENEHKAAIVYGYVSEAEPESIARIYLANQAIELEVEKKKSSDLYQNMKVSGRVEGSKTALDLMYGLENLELAYNNVGTYLGFGWKKGTLEYLEHRKQAGEDLELVYENDVFQGYGYLRRKTDALDDKNRYVPGATLALFEAIEVKLSGDSEDFAFRGVEINRNTSGVVTSIKVKKGFAGEKEEFVKSEKGIWKAEHVEREDTEVLFYDLHNLKVLETAGDGTKYGFDRNGQKVKITFDTKSIFAIRNGKAEFELSGGDFNQLKYDKAAGAFIRRDKNTVIYHLNDELCRDGLVDGYTGLAYIEKEMLAGEREKSILVWPVREIKNSLGTVISKEKILTGRPGEVNAGTECAYITGALNETELSFEKILNPVYDAYGMVRFYPESEHIYKTEEALYDRDGEFLGYRQEELLKQYNQACFGVYDPIELYGNDNTGQLSSHVTLKHRMGEAWIIPNIWKTGEIYPQDPSDKEITNGQMDLLRRVTPGNYIMEEVNVPEGYVRSIPIAVTVTDSNENQAVTMVNERIKVEIAKVDGTNQYKKIVESDEELDTEWSIETNGAYTGEVILGAKLALYRADRVYTSDYSRYPKGYYLTKQEDTPASWYIENSEDGSKKLVEAIWWTDGRVKYFEGIPAGDYILEELEVPAGYLPAFMELTVLPIDELQSFILKDDHTKVEIYKYEEDENGNKQPVTKPYEAELALYPVVTDALGNPVKRDGEYAYRNVPITQWKTGQSKEYKEALRREFENMYYLYDSAFSQFAWKWREGSENREGSARLESSQSTNGGESVKQVWRLDDQSALRVMIGKNAGIGQADTFGKIGTVFEYQFDYKQSEEIPDMVTYELLNGIRRLDRIPKGTYILVETKEPEGYKKAEPMVVVVEETDSVQRFYLKNQKEESVNTGKLLIEKLDEEQHEKKLHGARFEVKNLQTGEVYLLETDGNGQASLENLPIKGVYENGVAEACIYQVEEISAPDGYCINNSKWNVCFTEEGSGELVQKLEIYDEKTKFWIQKSDFGAGYFISGAVLAIYESRMQDGTYVTVGEPIERWISNENAHKIEGKLSCGKTYILVEEKAPSGYKIAVPVRFTVSEDGKKLTHLSNNLAQIQIHYKEDERGIASIVVSGQGGKKAEFELSKSDGSKIQTIGDGQPVFWNQMIENHKEEMNVTEGDILILEEYVEFWDGSRICLEREHIRVETDSARELISSGRYPIATEYVLKDRDGSRLEAWCVETGIEHYEIKNSRKENGEDCLQVGETYELEQFVILSDGCRQKVQTMSICLGQNGVVGFELSDQETCFEIRKTDITTGIEIVGAVLTVKNEEGDILEQWTSSEAEHVIQGTLIPGEQYVLSEVWAADGYAYAKEIPFVLRKDSIIEKVVMEDRLTRAVIQKIDSETGKALPGAILCLKDSEGNIVNQWVSDTIAYTLNGKLIAGETYTLEECEAPTGYCLADPISFQVSLDGEIDYITMENLRIREEKDDPDEEILPKEDNEKFGTITAIYQRKMAGDHILRIKIPEQASLTIIPKTSDEPFPWWAVCGLCIAFCGVIYLWMNRREE